MSLFNDIANLSDDALSIVTEMAKIKNIAKQLKGENPHKQQLRNEIDTRKGNKIPKNLIGNKSGVNFGEKIINGKKVQIMKSHTTPRIATVIGPTAAGKSTVIANRSMENSDNVGIFALNIDDALLKLYQSLPIQKRPIKELILSEDKITTFRFDIFKWFKVREDALVQLARKLALAIIPTPVKINDNPFWLQSSQNIVTGALIWGYRLGLNFAETLLAIQSTPLATFADEVGTNEEAKFLLSSLWELRIQKKIKCCKESKLN